MEFLALVALVVVGIPFIMPIVSWVMARRTRLLVQALEEVVARQGTEIERLTERVRELARGAPPAHEPAATVPAAPLEVREAPPPIAEARAEIPEVPPVEAETPAVPRVLEPEPVEEAAAIVPPLEPVMAAEATPAPAPLLQEETPAFEAPPPARPLEPPVPPPPPHPPATPAPFDWEGLVGVKLFSAIAGIALVFAAVFFLRYSIESGWLQPPVRVVIGVVVAVALLVVCELKAARRYPATANALDAAAIAILFATFFAAHALWNLIPALVTFGLLAIVTTIAVLLSIRRGSMFIAVLGLLGGFATPALLSTGENRPIPLFAYLMLLNVGLAWVAYRQTWPLLTWLTLILTTIYQWGWVMTFLDESSLSLAMGVFLAFPVIAVAGLTLARVRGEAGEVAGRSFERTAMLSAGLPLLFAVYLAAVPAYGAHVSLLFGFLLLLDLGLLAVAIARRQEVLHAVGAVATLLVMAVWLATSYAAADARFTVLGFTGAFVALYALAPAIARWFGRPFEAAAAQARLAASTLLFVFPGLAAVEPAFAEPHVLFGALFAIMLLIAWRTVATGDGPLYYVAAFFAIAAQGTWSATHLTSDRLGSAVVLYAVFGLLSMATPLLARRQQRPLMPIWGGGLVLLVSLGLLLFLSLGPVIPEALWAMALLLAILNAGLFVESASGGLPVLSQIGSLASWAILASWWMRAAGSIGIMPSLTVLTGLSLVTLGGHAWAHRLNQRTGAEPLAFRRGLYLALVGHLFLLLLALNREWALPPWPLFGALLVVTLGMSTVSLVTRTPALHAAGAIGAAVVIAAWSGAAGAPAWGLTAVVASLAIGAYAVAWLLVVARDQLSGAPGGSTAHAVGAGVVLFIGLIALFLATAGGTRPPFAALTVAYVIGLTAILWLTWTRRWAYVAVAAVAPGWLGLLQRYTTTAAGGWQELLILSSVIYAVFVAYPLVLGSRARGERDPYLAAVAASAMFFFSARNAFTAGGLAWAIGAVPVIAGAVLAVLLRQLVRIEPAGARDMGRLALVAGAALAFVTVAIPLQLRQQWITIGWALEGAALAWIYRRIPHRGLMYFGSALMAAVFVRLALNPEILLYEPRGSIRIFNWYLYTYLTCAVACFVAAWWLSKTDDRILPGLPRVSYLLPGAGVILLFLLLNIEIADYYATGPTIAFRFGVTVSQDLTYTIGWLSFGMALLAAGISLHNRPGRVTAVALIAVTTFKCFLYDLGSLEGLYRVASFVGLALSLALVSLALQKYVLSKPRGAA